MISTLLLVIALILAWTYRENWMPLLNDPAEDLSAPTQTLPQETHPLTAHSENSTPRNVHPQNTPHLDTQPSAVTPLSKNSLSLLKPY